MDTLTKEQKKVIAQVGVDCNISATKIADILEIDRTTVYRYAEEATPEDLQQFATEIKTMFYIKQQEIIAKILIRLEENLHEEWEPMKLAGILRIVGDSLK